MGFNSGFKGLKAVLFTDVQHVIIKAPSVLLYCIVIYLLAPNNCYNQPLCQCYYNSVNLYVYCQFSAIILVLNNEWLNIWRSNKVKVVL